MTIKVFETFAGIGSQHKSIKNINSKNEDIKFDIIATSEWDARCIIAYSAMHNKLNEETIEKTLKANNLLNEDQINEYLLKNVFSLNSKKPTNSITSKDLNFKKALVVANLINKNHSDIQSVKPSLIDQYKIDLITYSSPCQGLSLANMGRDKGIKDNSSTSHLIWQIGRIVSECKNKPKYLLLENVKNLVGKYSAEYQEWTDFLKSNG
ncbi:DNA (cytosine-5-)-methyltransferase [Mycoplasmopsis columboralis]|uniref:DNA (cytosine-5-)-methyltransferase n=1 Tax=Mycoplasmopsis columboralis TaxID=171282 RepID=A0A449B6J4_9BACT|nr:DNA (cytosine-5-)-methyltransferase [Mycoplasmopsis columboralis]